jgi:NIMA (never in mitosis gene a)-related kinase
MSRGVKLGPNFGRKISLPKILGPYSQYPKLLPKNRILIPKINCIPNKINLSQKTHLVAPAKNSEMDKTMVVTSLRDFQVEKKIGEGSYGSVYKAYSKETKEICAIKTIKVSQNDRKNIENTLTEIRILASIEHENIVSYKAAFLEGSDKVCLVMEFVGGGDL